MRANNPSGLISCCAKTMTFFPLSASSFVTLVAPAAPGANHELVPDHPLHKEIPCRMTFPHPGRGRMSNIVFAFAHRERHLVHLAVRELPKDFASRHGMIKKNIRPPEVCASDAAAHKFQKPACCGTTHFSSGCMLHTGAIHRVARHEDTLFRNLGTGASCRTTSTPRCPRQSRRQQAISPAKYFNSASRIHSLGLLRPSQQSAPADPGTLSNNGSRHGVHAHLGRTFFGLAASQFSSWMKSSLYFFQQAPASQLVRRSSTISTGTPNLFRTRCAKRSASSAISSARAIQPQRQSHDDLASRRALAPVSPAAACLRSG